MPFQLYPQPSMKCTRILCLIDGETQTSAVAEHLNLNLNFNMLNNDSCSPDNRLSEYCDRFQLTNIVTVPTRITDTSSALLDVILTTHPQ